MVFSNGANPGEGAVNNKPELIATSVEDEIYERDGQWYARVAVTGFKEVPLGSDYGRARKRLKELQVRYGDSENPTVLDREGGEANA